MKEHPTSDVRTCPTCNTPVPPARTFCKLSCRIEFDKRQVRTPRPPLEDLFDVPFESTDQERRAARQRRDAIGRLYRRRP